MKRAIGLSVSQRFVGYFCLLYILRSAEQLFLYNVCQYTQIKPAFLIIYTVVSMNIITKAKNMY
jgi:hypothetical protein